MKNIFFNFFEFWDFLSLLLSVDACHFDAILVCNSSILAFFEVIGRKAESHLQEAKFVGLIYFKDKTLQILANIARITAVIKISKNIAK